MSAKLRSDLSRAHETDVHVVKRIYIDLPPLSSHKGHILGDVRTFVCLLVPVTAVFSVVVS